MILPHDLRDPVGTWARRTPDAVALIDAATSERTTYAALDRRADAWVGTLRDRGVVRGDRVALLARNGVDHVALCAATTRLGATFVPLNWRLTPPELARLFGHLALRVLETDAEFAPLRDATSSIAVRATPPADDPTHPPAMLLATSGSTGEPKAVAVSHEQQGWNALATILGWSYSARDVGLVTTPLFHTAAWGVCLWPLLVAGGCTVLAARTDAARFRSLLARFGVTCGFVVPTQLHDVLTVEAGVGTVDGDASHERAEVDRAAHGARVALPALPALRWLLVGGAPCPPRLFARARAAGLPVRIGYGLTECGPNCFMITEEEISADPQRVGRPLPFLEAQIVDDAGQPVADGSIGELWLRGPQRMHGYWGDAARTADAIAVGGWLRTGDLAVRDAAGCHRIVGRARDLIISGGENVMPGEVETALLADDRVAEALVVGVPDERWGEVPAALIVPASPVADESALADAVRDALAARLAPYKRPRRLHVAAALPRTATGKPDRAAAARLLGAAAAEDRP